MMDNNISITNIEGYTITLDKNNTTISLQSQGPQGKSATVSVGNVTTLSPNEPVDITNSGTQYDAILNFSIPKGDKGDKGDTGNTSTIEIGNVDTLDYNQGATVTNTGTPTDAVFNFGIPRGDIPDITVGTVTTLPAGFNATVENVGTAEEAILNFGIPKGYDGTGATEGSTGYNANLHYTPLSSDVSGYLQLSYDVYPTETEYSNTIKNQELLLRSYLYPSQLGVTSIDGGTWSFTFTSKVSSATRDTQFKAEVFLRHIDNTETTLFGVYSSFIDNTVYQTFKVESSQQEFTCLTTDRLGVRVYGKTTSNFNVVLYIIVGDGRGGYFTTPLKIRHPQLRGLNEDSNFQHITVTNKSNYDTAYTLANNSADKDLSNISDIAKKKLFSRNIGEFVKSSIPLSDAGLHLADGSLLVYGAYSQFIDKMAGLYATNPELFCTETQWQSNVSTFGGCQFFVYDSANKTIRLPKWYDKSRKLIKKSGTASGFQRIYNDGWLEMQGYIAANDTNSNTTQTLLLPYSYIDTAYTFTRDPVGIGIGATGVYSNVGHTTKTVSSVTFYTETSANVSGFNWETKGYGVVPNDYTIPEYQYIVIANAVKTDTVINIDNVMTDLNSKAGKDELDGNWISSGVILSTATEVGDYNISLSTILPNDGCTYELALNLGIGSSSSTSCYVYISTDKSPKRCIAGTCSSNTDARNDFNIVIGSRVLTFCISSAVTSWTLLYLLGYRRVS